ncbi:MAG: methyltransferase domain-containing protein [Gammaproteobacteria bacterium]|nr:methyltransferase domain-containing protein [Gammaproteobacteria bacterium]
MKHSNSLPGVGGHSVAQRTLGPIHELEKHLPELWWSKLFDALYLKTDGDVVEDIDLTRQEVDQIQRFTGIGKSDRILDLCCGQGRHSLELARRGFKNVSGVDRSRYLIRLARRRAKKEGLSVTFREGDARKFRSQDNDFDCAMLLGNSFGYFDSIEQDQAVLARIREALKPGGKLLMDITDGEWMRAHFQPRSWEWIDQNQLVCRERQLASDDSRLICREVIIDAEKGVLADQFYAERLYNFEALQTLLQQNGFQSVTLCDRFGAASEKSQDPGMMSNRLWLVAVNGPKQKQPRSHPVTHPKMTVVLGDPRLPDQVKLNGGFSELDMDTVARLKFALDGLTDYEFSYLDNHSTLMETIQSDPPSFVVNLCDEGYQNEARKELHVPAILELYGIRYTGAGPTCLGICYNKRWTSALATQLEIPVPAETWLAPDEQGGTIPSVFPALIKPDQGDSSIGITKEAVVRNPREALRYVDMLKQSLGSIAILVQEFLPGAEYSVGLIGNKGLGYVFLPVLEVDYSGLPDNLAPILSYESKWDPASPYWTSINYGQASIPEELTRRLHEYSVRLFEHLGCRDYARFDFRCDSAGQPRLLEVNPNPGWCWDGKFNLMAEMAGYTYGGMLELIIRAAEKRYEAHQ